jgi:nucleoside-diphosphate-sugar epimerase
MELDSNLTVFIIGGEGFVGSAYTRFCQEHNLNHLVINRANYNDYIGSSCDLLINANGNSKKFLAKQDPLLEFDESVCSVRKSLLDFKAKKYVFLSSCDVYPDCSNSDATQESNIIDISMQSPYGFHKYLAEQCVRHSHEDWLIFRMGGFVGKGLKKNAIFDILSGEQMWLNPESELQYINTDIAANLVMEVIQKGYSKEVFNLCADGVIKLQEVIDITNSKVKVNPGSLTVHYEISIAKLQQIVNIPKTRDLVLDFIQSSWC